MNRLSFLFAVAAMLTLGACAALSGKHGSFAVFSPQLQLPPVSTEKQAVDWQLLVDRPRASAALDTTRIAVMPAPGVLEVYADARWRDPAPAMLRSLIVRAFENDGRISGVSATDAGLNGDYSLAIDLRDFQVELRNGPAHAAIGLSAKLYDRRSNRIVASRHFSEEAPAASSDAVSLLPAFEQALGSLLPKMVDWTITQGSKHESARAERSDPARS